MSEETVCDTKQKEEVYAVLEWNHSGITYTFIGYIERQISEKE